MQARAAYIRSFGTTSILVAAAVLILATVSALVAYRGWPGSDRAEGVTSVPLQPPQPAGEVRALRGPRTVPTARLGAALDAALAPRRARRSALTAAPTTVGLVKVVPRMTPAVPPAPDAAPDPAPAPGDNARVKPPDPPPPTPPSSVVPLPEPIGTPVEATEEFAFGVVGEMLPDEGEASVQGDPLGVVMDGLTPLLP